MKQAIFESAFFGVFISIASYALGVFLRKKTGKSFVNPLLIAVVVIVAALLLLDIDFDTYNIGGKYISFLLTPATVCLAVPLYQQLHLLRKHGKAVALAILVGVVSSAGSILALSYLFGLTHEQYVTLLPKSLTSAIGIGLSEELGGIPTITVSVIIITGVLGNIIAEGVFKLLRIRHPVAMGLALGVSSHAVGTAKALELGEIQGAMSSLSIAVAGLLTVAAASFFALLL